jgi:hypothetical protein
MALNPSGAISLAGPSAGQSIAVELGLSATAAISLNDVVVRTLAQVPSGVIVMPTDFYGKSSFTPTQKALFGFGLAASTFYSITNLVSNTGVVSADTPGVGTARQKVAAAGYGGDKAIFAYGGIPGNPGSTITNLVSNTGVVASDTPGVGNSKNSLAAAGYGGDKAIFGYGELGGSPFGTLISTTNLVSNTGVVSANTPGVGTTRSGLAAATYGGNNDKAIFGFGFSSGGRTAITNLVSNTGVVASDTPGVGTARGLLAAAGYGGDKAIFGYGFIGPAPSGSTAITNRVSNTGVVASDTPGVGQIRRDLAAAGYGGDKAIFGYGARSTPNNTFNLSMTNLVSNTGVASADTPGVGTARFNLAAAGYSTT